MMIIWLLLSISHVSYSVHRIVPPIEDNIPCKIKFTGSPCPVGRPMCEESGDCAVGLSCCNDGCGNSCKNDTVPRPVPPPSAPIPNTGGVPSTQSQVPQCPAVTIRYTFCRFTTYASCEQQTDCYRTGMLCCPDVCGRKCKFPVNPETKPVQDPVNPVQNPVPAEQVYKGTCPFTNYYQCRSPMYYCISDANCMLNERCCLDNCDYICKRVAVAKWGYCPVPPSDPTLRCTYYNKCYDDGDCPYNEKCCDHPCGRMCVGAVQQKNGVCRSYRPTNGFCFTTADMCHKDYDCPNRMKCCTYACGNRCQNPELPILPRPQYVCPPQTTYICVQWKNECATDSNCPLGRKCCNTGCGNACLRPTTFIYSG